ncbi:hypothetical protein [Parasphingorhabdus pacifica]
METNSPVVATPTHQPRRVFHVRDLEKLGVSQSTSYRRARADGPWSRLAPGIVLTAPGPATTDDLIQAALLCAGPDAMITGMHGARLHGLTTPPLDEPIHVLIPHSRKLQCQPSIRFERTTRLPTPVLRGGIPTAPLVRAVMDGARTWQTRAFTEDLFVEAIQRGQQCHPQQLIQEMELGSRRGTGLPRALLRSMTVEVRSIPELRAFKLLDASDLPKPLWNTPVFSTGGEYVGCPDAWFDDVGMAVEIDSFEFHFTKSGYSNTMRRNTRYATHGVLVVQILPGRLVKEPQAVVDDIRQAYFTARVRPRCEVYSERPWDP